MMVKKYIEFINEGMWAKGFERARTGEKRTEDKIISNIDKLKEIDIDSSLPFVFASDDVMFNGDDLIDIDIIHQHIDNIEKFGWRLPNRNDIELFNDILDESLFVCNWDGKKLVIDRYKVSEKIIFTMDYAYLIRDNTKPNGFSNFRFNPGTFEFRYYIIGDQYPRRIKLIKDKK